MKKFAAVVMIGFVFFFAVSSSTGFAMDEKERAEITGTVNALMNDIISAAEQGDVEKTFENLSREGDALYYLNDKSYDAPALLEFFKKEFAGMKSQKIEPAQSRVVVFSPDAAAWIANGSGYTVDLSGNQAPFSFTETWILQKIGGKWCVTHYHESVKE
ncbi:MAG TPA: nuclear transport factor 2 family protein [Candidatus Omnitrophota bacterium]|nr:nuclear transport factor 2 family protein [Candidatus Omnitrophota bacterium]